MDAKIERKSVTYKTFLLHQKSPAATPTHYWENTGALLRKFHVDFAGPMLGKKFSIVVKEYSK